MVELMTRERRARLWIVTAIIAAVTGVAAMGSPVSARLIANTATTGFMNATTTTTTVGQNGQVDLEMDWAVPPGTVEGDTIRLELPDSLRELTFQNFYVYDEVSGRVLAVASLEREGLAGPANDTAWIVFTFTDVIEEGGDGASGDAAFALSIEQSRLDFSTGNATIEVFELTVEVSPQPRSERTGKSGTWSPNRFEATRLDDDGRLIQTSRHQRWQVAIQTDLSTRNTDDWTAVTITEEPPTNFTINCSTDGGVFVNGFKLQVFNTVAETFEDVPRPSPSGASITSAVCNADGSTEVVVEKLAGDTDRQYRIVYFTDLRTLDGRPAYEDAAGELVVGFPSEYRNEALVLIGATETEISTAVRAEELRAIGRLSNGPAIDIEKYSGTWAGVEFNPDGTANVTAAPDYEAIVQPTGDFDTGPGLQLEPTEAQPVTFTVTNIGTERLVDIIVGDTTDVGPALTNIVCTFPDATTGTAWEGPFIRSTSFPCTAELPALGTERQHVDTARVDAVGFTTRTPVFDEDVWQAFAERPDIDIEKFSGTWDGVVFDGLEPALDATGQPVPQPSDDFDTGALAVDAGEPVIVYFVVTNTGTVPLDNIDVADVTDAGPDLTNLRCTFPDSSTGTTWVGPFAPQDSFPCTATMPGLDPDADHADTATVTGEYTNDDETVILTDSDAWGAEAPPPTTTTTTTTQPPATTTTTTQPPATTTTTTTVVVPPTPPPTGLPDTGPGSAGQLSLWATILLVTGLLTLGAATRRRSA